MPSSACDWSSDVCSSDRSEEHTSELQSRSDLVCRLLLEKKKNKYARSARRPHAPAFAHAHRPPARPPTLRHANTTYPFPSALVARRTMLSEAPALHFGR